MFKLILSLICLAALAHAQCPTGSTNIHGNQRTNYCYIYLGKTDLHAKAESKCAALNFKLVQPKTKEGLPSVQIVLMAVVSELFANQRNVF